MRVLPARGSKLERFQFRRNHTNERALRLKSSTGSVKVGIALVIQTPSHLMKTPMLACNSGDWPDYGTLSTHLQPVRRSGNNHYPTATLEPNLLRSTQWLSYGVTSPSLS